MVVADGFVFCPLLNGRNAKADALATQTRAACSGQESGFVLAQRNEIAADVAPWSGLVTPRCRIGGFGAKNAAGGRDRQRYWRKRSVATLAEQAFGLWRIANPPQVEQPAPREYTGFRTAPCPASWTLAFSAPPVRSS
jgi:hypothetical protein